MNIYLLIGILLGWIAHDLFIMLITQLKMAEMNKSIQSLSNEKNKEINKENDASKSKR